jgi:hypothetical protein
MTSDGQSVERLREYLRALKPDARATLMAELERGLLRGEAVAGGEFVLEELRSTIRAAAQTAPRLGDAARLFFAPFEPFLIEAKADHKRAGRLARSSLVSIWEWLGRDLMPAEIRALSDDINRALLANERVKVEQLIRALHDRAIQRIRDALGAVGTDERAQRRFAVQVGTPRALDDVAAVIRILDVRDALADLARRLPGNIRAFEREHIDGAKAMFDSEAAAWTLDGNPTRKSEFFLCGLVILMGRLAAPWQLTRIAVRAAGSDEAARIAETPYAAAVTIVLSEIENMVGELRAELKAGRPVTAMLRGIHDAARSLRNEMDLPPDSAWGRQLAALRSEVSNLLRAEIESAPGRVRRLLRPRPNKDIVPGSLLDAADVGEVEALVAFVSACRQYGSELAVSEVTLRTYSELEHYLETGTKVLLDSLRHAGDDDRTFRQSQVDAAIRFCRTVFGSDYAGLLVKAADIAIQTGASDRKQARG